MRVRMKVEVSGRRNGRPWPKRGEVVNLPESEAAELCAAGMAETVKDETEKAVPKQAEATEPKPAETTEKPAPEKRGPGRPRKNA